MSGARRMSGITETVPTSVLVALLGVAAALYSVFVAEQVLLAVLIVGAVVLIYGGIVVRRNAPWSVGGSTDRYSKPMTTVLIAGVVLYGLVITQNLVLTLLATVSIVAIYAAWRVSYAFWTDERRSDV